MYLPFFSFFPRGGGLSHPAGTAHVYSSSFNMYQFYNGGSVSKWQWYHNMIININSLNVISVLLSIDQSMTTAISCSCLV